jgi:hypothetical protein
MAEIHKVDYKAVGLSSFGKPSGYIQVGARMVYPGGCADDGISRWVRG